jgi:putative transposase
MAVKKRYVAIQQLSERGFEVKLLCSLAEVSRSGYYRYLQANSRPAKDASLVDTVRSIQEDVRYSYGAKRMARYLSLTEGIPINHKRIARIMNENLLNARVRKRRHPAYWYRQRHRERLSDRQCGPNILARNFSSILPLKKLVTDVTWVTFAGGMLYLSAVMDLFNHEIVSYGLSIRNTTEAVLAPVRKLVAAKDLEGVLLHCDRGPTYRSEEYQTLLEQYKMVSSYSRAGNCWDNALMECFFGHLKCELGYVDGRNKRQNFHHVTQEINDYISFYNERRIQKNLGWKSPLQYRNQRYDERESISVST